MPNKGKPFSELLHGDCGVFREKTPEKNSPTPIPHVPVLAGTLLASQIILSKIIPDDKSLIESTADFDALKKPNSNCIFKKQKHPKCFCNDLIYQESYKEKWNT